MWEAGSVACVDGRAGGMRRCAESNRHCYTLTSIVLLQITGSNHCKSARRLRWGHWSEAVLKYLSETIAVNGWMFREAAYKWSVAFHPQRYRMCDTATHCPRGSWSVVQHNLFVYTSQNIWFLVIVRAVNFVIAWLSTLVRDSAHRYNHKYNFKLPHYFIILIFC